MTVVDSDGEGWDGGEDHDEDAGGNAAWRPMLAMRGQLAAACDGTAATRTRCT